MVSLPIVLLLLTFFPKYSYLGVLRLFLRVLEVARSRRLGSVGEVSVWPDPATRETRAGCQFRRTLFWRRKNFFLRRKNLGGRNFLLEKRSLVDFPITIIGRFSNKESARARICSGATRAGVFFYTEIADNDL